jgi:hypothetical protein
MGILIGFFGFLAAVGAASGGVVAAFFLKGTFKRDGLFWDIDRDDR